METGVDSVALAGCRAKPIARSIGGSRSARKAGIHSKQRTCQVCTCRTPEGARVRRTVASESDCDQRRCWFNGLKTTCPGGDSNPHALRRHPLKMVCLPVPPPGLCEALI